MATVPRTKVKVKNPTPSAGSGRALAAKRAARMGHPRVSSSSPCSPRLSEPGRFGVYGGRYVPEALMAAIGELERGDEKGQRDPQFKARRGEPRLVAETGAGQHGVATATVCALLGFECVVYMGTEDMRRQELNVFR